MNSGKMASPSSCNRGESGVHVTLTAQNPDSLFVVPIRQITLTRNGPSIRIGRASKQESKGFVAARENAWFDSPVMSREHAQLSVDFDTKTVLLEDIGSLHGTFRRTKEEDKEDRLAAREKVSLKSGDMIRLGTDIYRGSLTFPPCMIQVEWSWNLEHVFPNLKYQRAQKVKLTVEPRPAHVITPSRATPTNTFSVPDYDDEEDLLSDNDGPTETDRPLPTQIDTIDLTGKSPVKPHVPKTRSAPKDFLPSMDIGRLGSDVIDLTSEPETRNVARDVQPLPEPMVLYDSDVSSELPYIGGYTESEDDSLSDHHTNEDEAPSSPFASEPEINSHNIAAHSPLYDTDLEINSVADEAIATVSVSSFEDISSDMWPWEADESSNESDSDDPSEVADSENDDGASVNSEEDENNLNNVPYWDEGGSSGSEGEDDTLPSSLFDKQTSPTVAFTSSSPPAVSTTVCSGAIQNDNISPTICQVSKNHCGPATPFLQVRPTPQTVGITPQQPLYLSSTQTARSVSPSDAVMAKSHPITAAECVPSSTAQALGERTGKYEFFAARDYNRASVIHNPLIPEVLPVFDPRTVAEATEKSAKQESVSACTVGVIPKSTMARPPWREPEPAKDVMDDTSLEPPSSSKQPHLMDSAWTPFGEAFLKEPHNYSIPLSNERTRLQSPELDMTSAATFVESKKKRENDLGRSRRRLAIKSLISQESKEASPALLSNGNDVSPRPPKRSYDEVFAEVEPSASGPSLSPILGIPAPSHLHPDKTSGDAVMETTSTIAELEAGNGSHAETKITQDAVPASASLTAIENFIPAVVALDSTAQSLDVRPAKKRRFSKFAKYASVSVVSGVTSAALLFAGLAATAPQIV